MKAMTHSSGVNARQPTYDAIIKKTFTEINLTGAIYGGSWYDTGTRTDELAGAKYGGKWKSYSLCLLLSPFVGEAFIAHSAAS